MSKGIITKNSTHSLLKDDQHAYFELSYQLFVPNKLSWASVSIANSFKDMDLVVGIASKTFNFMNVRIAITSAIWKSIQILVYGKERRAVYIESMVIGQLLRRNQRSCYLFYLCNNRDPCHIATQVWRGSIKTAQQWLGRQWAIVILAARLKPWWKAVWFVNRNMDGLSSPETFTPRQKIKGNRGICVVFSIREGVRGQCVLSKPMCMYMSRYTLHA